MRQGLREVWCHLRHGHWTHCTLWSVGSRVWVVCRCGRERLVVDWKEPTS